MSGAMTSETEKELLLRVAGELDTAKARPTWEPLPFGALVLYGEELDTISRVLREAAEGWRPIETAPKDGTRVLLASLAVEKAGQAPEWSIVAGCWQTEFEIERYRDDEPVYRGAWTDFTVASWGYQEFTELSPVVWRPLPSPPASAPAEVSRG